MSGLITAAVLLGVGAWGVLALRALRHRKTTGCGGCCADCPGCTQRKN